ncbi:Osmosensitive K+ channel histidine kinase KdpD [Labilithrix luteola]|uniref:histidine kinase n=1 Tax=Labilithrix luteola TaxID=1391654 RepID=A0A0K1QCX5_9BACT|nr:sensor histidine kinase KdpD [Labilithrix luteola]AKV03265.1 Osmosensitive K+ channel histidine kinase KdpD [Labilithrix luteola]
MSDRRPTPEELLARVREEQSRAHRGKLTVFFGAAPGVGKTYAMLEAARFEREEGRDVVVGLVETHGRYDTGALLLGLEILARRKTVHRGLTLEELDVDAAIARRPGVILVDELAHTNAPDSRHAKRWQDIEELLQAGIDVYTTLNVQHLESLNDVVAQITHVVVRETVPDAVFEKAYDVRLIDLPIDELTERLREGKVYVPDQARLASEGFFREGNLIALRELALRVTAQRVDLQMRRYRAEHGIERTWPAAERILVCVSPSPSSARLIRSARRLATGLHADWIAAYVETPGALRLSAKDRERVNQHHILAQGLGAETVTLGGGSGPAEIVRFARSRNVTRILVGKPTHARWRDFFTRSFLDELVRTSGDIDVHVLAGDEPEGRAKRDLTLRVPRGSSNVAGFVAAAVTVAVATFLGRMVLGQERADIVMLYLLGIVLVSMRWGLGPSLTAAIAAVLSFDFFFVPPYYTFAVSDIRHVVTFAVMFLVASVISGLTKRVRDQADSSRERELRTSSLYSLSRALTTAKTAKDVLAVGIRHVHEVFGTRCVALLPGDDGKLVATEGGPTTFVPDEKERGVAEWVWTHGTPAGLDTDTLPSASALYLPLETSSQRAGVLGLLPSDKKRIAGYEARQHLDAFVGQIAAAIERTKLAEQAQQAQLRVEREQLRNSLLSSVSHDLRTPLAVITGAASTLLDARLEPDVARDLTETVLVEAERLNRLVRNLLDMTRLEAGAVEVHKEWQPVEEAVGAALERTQSALGDRPVQIDLPDDLPLVPYDSILLQQVLVNLLENVAKYTPSTAEVHIAAHVTDNGVEIDVADRGPGLPEGEEAKVFEKFYRAEKGRGGGAGLGLTISQGIVTAHGGRMWARNRDGGGAEFSFTLPIEGVPPQLDESEPVSQASEPASDRSARQ